MTQIGWYNQSDDVLLSLDEVEQWGHCYPPLRPVYVADADA